MAIGGTPLGQLQQGFGKGPGEVNYSVGLWGPPLGQIQQGWDDESWQGYTSLSRICAVRTCNGNAAESEHWHEVTNKGGNKFTQSTPHGQL